jgi:hypothetical protein
MPSSKGFSVVLKACQFYIVFVLLDDHISNMRFQNYQLTSFDFNLLTLVSTNLPYVLGKVIKKKV